MTVNCPKCATTVAFDSSMYAPMFVTFRCGACGYGWSRPTAPKRVTPPVDPVRDGWMTESEGRGLVPFVESGA